MEPTTQELRQKTYDADMNLTDQYEKFQKMMLDHMEWKFGKDSGDYSKHPRAQLDPDELKQTMAKYGDWNANGSTNFTHHFEA